MLSKIYHIIFPLYKTFIQNIFFPKIRDNYEMFEYINQVLLNGHAIIKAIFSKIKICFKSQNHMSLNFFGLSPCLIFINKPLSEYVNDYDAIMMQMTKIIFLNIFLYRCDSRINLKFL